MTNYQKTMCIAVALMASVANAAAAEWDAPAPKDCLLESGQTYYVYNPGSSTFIFTNGVETRLNSKGTPLTLTKINSEDWYIYSPVGYLYSDIGYIGCDAGADGASTAWYIEKQSAATFRFRPSKNDPDFSWEKYPDNWTGIATSTWTLTPLIKAEEGLIDWYIISENDYPFFESKTNLSKIMEELQGYGYDVKDLLAVYNTATTQEELDKAIESVADVLNEYRLEHASEDNPVDVTYKYVRNADLTEGWVNDGHDVPGWTMVPASFCGMGEMDGEGFYSDNKTLGSWSAGAFGDNKIYQKLTGLKNGKYRFGNYGIWIRHIGEDGDPIKGAYIYAKVGEKIFKEPLADTGWWRGLSEVTFECRTGEAEVGIMFEGTNVGQCIILDFKLEYLGEKTAVERLNALTALAQSIISEGGIYSAYADMLNNDIEQASKLIADNDIEAQEALFAKFEADCEAAQKNKDAYIALQALVETAKTTLSKGSSEEMDLLSDFITENDLEQNIMSCKYNNEDIDEIIKTLTELNDKASNSVIQEGADVTYLVVNGKFDTTGGWVATLNDFSINPDLGILERWWGDWSAEQVIENVANGKYRLQVQGFQWCSWDWAQSEADWHNSDKSPTALSTSKLRLNDGEVMVQNVFACGKTDIQEGYQGGEFFVPNDATTAIKFFELGLYENVVEGNVTDNTLRITFDCSKNGFWNCFKNLRLTYLGADMDEALEKLSVALEKSKSYLDSKYEGALRKSLENALENGNALLDDKGAKFDDVNAATNTLTELFEAIEVSIKNYAQLGVAINSAGETLQIERYATTEAGKALAEYYATVKADYDSDYPSFDNASAKDATDKLNALVSEAKLSGGIKEGDDLTDLMTNPSFENTYGNDVSVGGGAHNIPYGWAMQMGDKTCYTAQEIYDNGINSFTAIEENAYTTDGKYSYCLLSAPTPDCFLFQTINGLPAGTYKVTVDMNVTYDGGCSRVTGQRLVANNNVQYYGPQSYYVESELKALHPEEIYTFGGYEEVNTNETGESGDMGNMSTLSVEVALEEGQSLKVGVHTDNNKTATTRSYEENYWDCCGRYKIDNFRLYCINASPSAIKTVETSSSSSTDAYNLMGVKVNPDTVHGLYIQNGKKHMKR